MPIREATSPTITTRIGRAIAVIRICPTSAMAPPDNLFNNATEAVAAMAIVAMIEPTYDSKISAPIPAISPTLSPTLSAIVAGFRGSSSGIPASTLPTKSAPTSADFV